MVPITRSAYGFCPSRPRGGQDFSDAHAFLLVHLPAAVGTVEGGNRRTGETVVRFI